MTEFCERRIVHCPVHEAAHYLAAFVADHQGPDGAVRIELRLPVSRVADRRPLGERPLVASLYPLQSRADCHPTYSVTWLPMGDGPSPEFAGALAVENGPGDDCFSLMLSGHCEARRSAGVMVDAAHGRRIARVSAHDVLRAIADHMEYARAHDAAALAGHRPLGGAPAPV